MAPGARLLQNAAVTTGRDPALLSALAALGCPDADSLRLGGIAARDLAQRFGTPLYAFAGDALRARLAAVHEALGPPVTVLFSVKANPSVALCAVLRQAGAGAEVASAGELCVAEKAGWAPADLRFAGPGKTDAEIDFALARGLGTFHVESATEAARLAALATRRGVVARVALRVNLTAEPRGSRQRMGGSSVRFGVDEVQCGLVLAAMARNPALRLAGLHVYGGTQCFDAEAFVAQGAALLQAAVRWERDLGVRLDEIDLGGGFGLATYHGDPSFDLAAAGAGVRGLIAAHTRPGRRWFVELGRYLAGPAGVYLCRVTDAKTSGGVHHLVLDGGLHHCALAAGMGSVLRRPPLLVAAEHLRAATTVKTTVGGPLCTPMDQFAEALDLPELAVGDLLAVLHTGAYGLTYSPTGFLSHPLPAEVLVEGCEARVIRARGTFEDALRGQRW